MDLNKLLQYTVDHKASDLFLTVGVPPTIKTNGELVHVLDTDALTEEKIQMYMRSLMTKKQQKEFSSDQECNFSIEQPNLGRFRVNVYIQRKHPAIVLRYIKSQVASFDQLGLPADTMKKLSMLKRGLILFVGATGVGKSTSLAAMIDYRNTNNKGHIITVEDPIEFVFTHKQSIVSQREVGIDTASFDVALKNVLRQSPDTIMIGEIRDQKTMEYVLAFSETGHLCFSTLHANNANQALNKIINFFPQEYRKQVLLDLSLNLRAIVAQQLIPSKDGKTRQLAVEIMLNTPAISELIRGDKIVEIKQFMTRSSENGMQTFDQDIFRLYSQELISYQAALASADSANNLRLLIKLNSEENTEELQKSVDPKETVQTQEQIQTKVLDKSAKSKEPKELTLKLVDDDELDTLLMKWKKSRN